MCRRMKKGAQLRDIGEAVGSLGSLALLAPIAVGAGGGYLANAITEPGPEDYEDLRRAERIATLQMLAQRSKHRRKRLEEKARKQEAGFA